MARMMRVEEIDTLLPPKSSHYAVARIDETTCIGCTLCIAACPVDAIVGATKFMHTVIAEHCTGCELCLPPCPVDCIAMVACDREWTRSDAAKARDRFARRKARIAGESAHDARQALSPIADTDKMRRQAAVAAALARARHRRAQRARR
jgi:electron transport complex protein RnfB